MGGIRILIDSNVLISGLVYGGNEIELIFLSERDDIELLISDHIRRQTFISYWGETKV